MERSMTNPGSAWFAEERSARLRALFDDLRGSLSGRGGVGRRYEACTKGKPDEETRRALGLPSPRPEQRKCMACGASFMSSDVGHRLCDYHRREGDE